LTRAADHARVPAGTTPLFSHGSWIPTYTNDVIIDWLFEQRAEVALP